jgi:hypothetical protein
VVVKNVSGYDLRLVIGSDPSLNKPLRLERAVLRLRPSRPVTRIERTVTETDVTSSLEAARRQGATYAFAYPLEGAWCVRSEFWDETDTQGESASSAAPATGLRDSLGAFPRAERALSDLERAVLAAL